MMSILEMKHQGYGYVAMGVFMILAGALSTMNVWANSWDDVRFSINDVYMIALMTSWMFVFMSLYDGNLLFAILSGIGVLVSLYCIRNQVFVSERQFLLGMIPHHSMAIHMSKQLSKRENSIQELLLSILKTQAEEIAFMKRKLAG